MSDIDYSPYSYAPVKTSGFEKWVIIILIVIFVLTFFFIGSAWSSMNMDGEGCQLSHPDQSQTS